MKIKPMNNYGMQTVTSQARGGVNLHTPTYYQAVELLAYVIRFLAHFVGYLAQAGLLIFITPPSKNVYRDHKGKYSGKIQEEMRFRQNVRL